MLSLTGTLLIVGAAVNLANYLRITARIDSTIDILYRNGGDFPAAGQPGQPDPSEGFQIREETAYETRYCIIRIDPDARILSLDLDHIAALDRGDIFDMTARLAASGHSAGYEDCYRYRFFEEESGSTLVILDCFLQLEAFYAVLRLTVLIFFCCLLIAFFPLLLLSGRVIRPFAVSQERQKRFITDASHELRTPLGIILANTGVSELIHGADEWSESTKNQVTRMNYLITELIELARTDEACFAGPPEIFSASALAAEAARDLATLAQTQGKPFSCQIDPDLFVRGYREPIRRLFSVLMENAVKYCDPGGSVTVALRKKRRQLLFTVSNPCRDLDPKTLPQLFDRFYRADGSRARESGGFGIGLSIARSTAERHRGRVFASAQNGAVTFTAILPLCTPPRSFFASPPGSSVPPGPSAPPGE